MSDSIVDAVMLAQQMEAEGKDTGRLVAIGLELLKMELDLVQQNLDFLKWCRDDSSTEVQSRPIAFPINKKEQ